MSPFLKFKRKIQKVMHTKLQYRHLKHFMHVLVLQPNLSDIILKKMFLKSPLKLMKKLFFCPKTTKTLEGFAWTYLLINFFPQTIIGMHDRIRICKFFMANYLFIGSMYSYLYIHTIYIYFSKDSKFNCYLLPNCLKIAKQCNRTPL